MKAAACWRSGLVSALLTWELSRRAGKVVCLELDKSLKPILEETLADCPNATVLFQDVTKTDCAAPRSGAV